MIVKLFLWIFYIVGSSQYYILLDVKE